MRLRNKGTKMKTYHGTDRKFETPDSARFGTSTEMESDGSAVLGFWSTEDIDYARDYAANAGGDTILECEVDSSEYEHVQYEDLRNMEEDAIAYYKSLKGLVVHHGSSSEKIEYCSIDLSTVKIIG
jgi:hypothetical protein